MIANNAGHSIAGAVEGLPARPTPAVLDLLDRRQLATVLRCSERTVIRREREGMPFIPVGRLRLYDQARVREWLVSHERHHATPTRGRPRKQAA